MRIQDLIQNRYTGEVNNQAEYLELTVQALTVLIFGIVVWRLMAMYQKRKTGKRIESKISRTRYSNQWRK